MPSLPVTPDKDRKQRKSEAGRCGPECMNPQNRLYFLDAKCTAACWNVGPSAVTASTSGANIAYWSLLRGKSGPPTEVGRFVLTPRTPSAYAPDNLPRFAQ